MSGSTPNSASEEAFTPIAVIGMALRMPGADTEYQLHELLAAGRDAMDAIPLERLELAGLDPEGTYPPLAALSRIEEFDHAFFKISSAEAVAMDPHQRLALQLAHAAIENAGQRPSRLRGSDCGVFFAAPRPDYVSLVGDRDLVSMLGTQSSALAGRISHQLGLQGPAVVVDTGCSSALVALQHACRELAADATGLALIGAVSLFPTLFEQADTVQEVVSESGTCRAFDVSADGTAPGEGGAVLLLKRLDRALEDADQIHAVIRSVAVNHNGDRSNGFSAPGPAAQAEVIERAWRLAGLDLDRLTYLEAHGSGTRLGDMIEIESAQRVLRAAGAARHACDVGTIKSNIGHLGNAAGLAGLLKAVLAVKHATRYASINVATPNPQFAAHGEPLRVRTTTEPWTEQQGVSRVAGVSSFTLIGTNAHAVVEEPPKPARYGAVAPAVVTRGAPAAVSAASRGALRRRLTDLAEHLAVVRDEDLPDVLFTLNAGRDHYPYRAVLPATGGAAGLRHALTWAAESVETVDPVPTRRLVLLLTDPEVTGPAVWEGAGSLADTGAWKAQSRAYQRAWADADADADADAAVPDLTRHQYAAVQALRAAGVEPALIVGLGRSRAVARALRGEVSLAQAWAQERGGPDGPAPELVAARLAQGEPSAFRVLGPAEPAFEALGAGGHDLALLDLTCPDGLVGAVAGVYLAGVPVDWEAYPAGSGDSSGGGEWSGRPRPVALPGYPFEPTRCWPGVTPAVSQAGASVPAGAAPAVAGASADPQGKDAVG
ncbi:acyl transferase domain-containing protein, partial [Streptacidiphilus sp. MAP12-20]|uniref:beta-ketoacyl synthase N-terminal-like domain-containing protein n=1 Tax=Streptacidiphilus sp. MAP12-20 TaxID=3156299 RepID=UPI00351786BB